jgi:hypothetical protein
VEWIELMAAYEAGDLPQRAFCKAHGVPYSSFGYWRRRLAEEAGAKSAAVVELPAVLGERLAGGVSGAGWRVELMLRTRTVLRIR